MGTIFNSKMHFSKPSVRASKAFNLVNCKIKTFNFPRVCMCQELRWGAISRSKRPAGTASTQLFRNPLDHCSLGNHLIYFTGRGFTALRSSSSRYLPGPCQPPRGGQGPEWEHHNNHV